MTYVYQAWPAWHYGPNGETEIFQREEDVPKGWRDRPSRPEVAPELVKFDGGVQHSRKALMAELKKRGIKFHVGMKTAVLEALLAGEGQP